MLGSALGFEAGDVTVYQVADTRRARRTACRCCGRSCSPRPGCEGGRVHRRPGGLPVWCTDGLIVTMPYADSPAGARRTARRAPDGARRGRDRARLDRARLGRGGDRQDVAGARVRGRVEARARLLPAACDDLRDAAHARPAARRGGGTAAAGGGAGDGGQVFTRAAGRARRERADGADRRGRALGRRRDARRARLRGAAGRGARRAAGADRARRGGRPGHPLHRLLGMLAGEPVHRLELDAALARRGRGARRRHGRDAGRRARADARQPVLRRRGAGGAAGRGAGERQGRGAGAGAAVEPECRDALERLSVVPSTIPTRLARRSGAPRRAGRGRARGADRARPDGLGFRHELARRAIEQSLPALRRRLLNAGRGRGAAGARRADRARLLHHAAEAGDVETLLAEGPAAAREAARAGSHRQALAHFEAVVAARRPAASCAERAALLNDYAWELYNAASVPRGGRRVGARPSGSTRARRAGRARRSASCGSRGCCS